MIWNRGGIPLLSKEGWLPLRKYREATSQERPGWLCGIRTTPAAPVKERGDFLEARSHPSLERRGMPTIPIHSHPKSRSHNSFTPFTDRAYSRSYEKRSPFFFLGTIVVLRYTE